MTHDISVSAEEIRETERKYGPVWALKDLRVSIYSANDVTSACFHAEKPGVSDTVYAELSDVRIAPRNEPACNSPIVGAGTNLIEAQKNLLDAVLDPSGYTGLKDAQLVVGDPTEPRARVNIIQGGSLRLTV